MEHGYRGHGTGPGPLEQALQPTRRFDDAKENCAMRQATAHEFLERKIQDTERLMAGLISLRDSLPRQMPIKAEEALIHLLQRSPV